MQGGLTVGPGVQFTPERCVERTPHCGRQLKILERASADADRLLYVDDAYCSASRSRVNDALWVSTMAVTATARSSSAAAARIRRMSGPCG